MIQGGTDWCVCGGPGMRGGPAASTQGDVGQSAGSMGDEAWGVSSVGEGWLLEQ